STIQPFYSVSHDRGATWSTAALIDSDADMGLSIMDAAVDPAGNFYLTWHDFRSPSSAEIYAASSLDRGNTWKPEVKVSDPTGMSDVIPRIVAPRDREVVISWLSDRSAGAHDDVFAARSIDGGATFATDTRINSNAEGSLVVVSNKMCSDGNGNIYAAYGLYTSGAGFMGDIYVATSNDFGASWSAHKKIDGARIQGSGLVITALDCVFDGQNGHAVVGFSGSTDGSTSDDAFTSVSSDAGATWQSAQRVNTGLAPLAGHDPLGLSVGIDPRGHVLTAWNDTRSGSIEIYFNYSNNFGDTWASTDIRMNGGTPGAHDAILTNENFIVLSTFAEGTNGTHNTDRLAFHNTFFDDRAGAQGMYDGIVEFTGDMQVLNRLAGANRIETSVAINQDLFPTAGTAPAVVISTSENFPDGLAAGPLAAMLNGSLLLNPKDSLDPAVALEITRVLDHKPSPASNIYVVGGPAAISDAVIAQLQGISSHARVAHIFGQNRYETAIAVAEQMDQIRGSGPTGAMLTTGENFPDALSASGPASDSGINPGQMPILLVTLNGLEPEVSNYLDSVKTSLKNIYTVGGPSALSEAVSSAAAARVPGVVLDRLAGLNRYETATAVARFFYTGAMLPQGIGLASGEKFPDALGGGRASGAKHRPLVLTTKDDLTATSSSYIGDNAGTLDSGDVYGGTAVIDESIVGTINLMI
ncbi:MAG: cell wall-binding repeat-containing protein, partial [bacterium]|nr:cell wall-binding repeat-containing protein [bacterium]